MLQRLLKTYALPFGKVRKRNTVYIEEKSGSLNNCGFYVDVFPYDSAPDDDKERARLVRKRVFWARTMLMKHKYSPWREQGKYEIKKRIGYIFYQLISLFFSHDSIVNKYENAVFSIPETEYVYEQIGKLKTHYYKRIWLNQIKEGVFENFTFNIPLHTHERLSEEYGNYMELPPEDKRENRHSIIKVVFSNGEEYNNV